MKGRSAKRDDGESSHPGLEAKGKRLLNVKDAARYLGISSHLLYRWRFQGNKLPVVKIGSCLRYDVRDLDRFISKHKIGTGK